MSVENECENGGKEVVVEKAGKVFRVCLDYDRGTLLGLSEKEKVAVEAFIQYGDYGVAARCVEKECRCSCSVAWVKSSLENESVAKYIGGRLVGEGAYNGWTKERFIRVLDAWMAGKKDFKDFDGFRVVFDNMTGVKLGFIARHFGWEKVAQVNVFNNQINFTQADGD